MEIQGAQNASGSMKAKQQKKKTIDAVCIHGSMMLSLGQAQTPELRNANQIHYLKQVGKKVKVRVVKKSMASILDCIRWWDDERVFKSTWVMEDGTVMFFFVSNVITDIETYVTN